MPGPHSFTPMMTGEGASERAATVATADREADAVERLGALFDAHHQRLYRLARRMSRGSDEARDLQSPAICEDRTSRSTKSSSTAWRCRRRLCRSGSRCVSQVATRRSERTEKRR